MRQYQNQQWLAFNEWQQTQISQASSHNHGTSVTATKSDEKMLAVNQLMALVASAAPAPMTAKALAGNTVQAPVEKATEAPASMAAKESAGRI